MAAYTGLDTMVDQDFATLAGKRIVVVCNQAGIASDRRHILQHLVEAKANVHAAFGPQHGLWGHTQDNMIEWEGARDARFPFPIHSLYGESREPTDEQLAGADALVIDLPDVGAKYYTFIWTMALCMKACERIGLPVTVLDRPNPIGGFQQEGCVGKPEFASFVGLYSLPIRHGMTIGEIANYLRQSHFPKLKLDVVPMRGWKREMYFEETGLPWAMPSPNMPTPDTTVIYPGGCLLEATNMSEGRGTTRPFEMFGAPFVDGFRLCDRLNVLGLQGILFRPVQFQPTFNKFSGETCEGAFLHVTDRRVFEPFLAHVAIIQEILRLYESLFAWKLPPYEYELVKMPIDILAGNDWLRRAIEWLVPLAEIRDRARTECEAFAPTRSEALIY